MKQRQGYILLEVIISVFIMSIIIACLYNIINVANKANSNIEDRIELSQQIEEMDSHIRNLVQGCMNIINITTVDRNVISDLEYDKVYTVSSIKLNFKNDDNKNEITLKNREISLKKSSKKLFINTLRANNSSESGGYEIGDYVKSIRIKKENPKIISIILNLEKNNIEVEKEIKLYIRYDALEESV
ncbi:type IV pilus modification PilV family protein [Intestinibacter bartlettii]|uniref:Prepilin-type N-terminal cleavage/methylation domain-containing protein n=1 Tax=Intestinibacter bartlettii TaxID=261299 RepID=A0ABS6E0A6_9FIRM|nr:prepilin-type N-terminal cleavage/methylation domain-containing protein [Intestinibacter bartlettii]MBU5337539.1 prepilin-type N-terminal cleavage/methylation domain-containing protein [Intestinibacter bartlettii]